MADNVAKENNFGQGYLHSCSTCGNQSVLLAVISGSKKKLVVETRSLTVYKCCVPCYFVARDKGYLAGALYVRAKDLNPNKPVSLLTDACGKVHIVQHIESETIGRL